MTEMVQQKVPDGARVAAEKPPFVTLALAWAAVALPLCWGVSETLAKVAALFQ
jgi:hypothetical protein